MSENVAENMKMRTHAGTMRLAMYEERIRQEDMPDDAKIAMISYWQLKRLKNDGVIDDYEWTKLFEAENPAAVVSKGGYCIEYCPRELRDYDDVKAEIDGQLKSFAADETVRRNSESTPLLDKAVEAIKAIPTSLPKVVEDKMFDLAIENMRDERMKAIAKVIEDRFGKTDCQIDGNEASIYFRANKVDGHGRSPAVLVLTFTYRANKWWIVNKDLSLPIWDCLRNECKIDSY